MAAYFETGNLAVGYGGKTLIDNINIEINRGEILTLIGPNGGGKTTILKTVTRHIDRISGHVTINGRDISEIPAREFAKQVAVVLTDRVRPELITCAQIVAMGRYPYTDMIGRLTERDRQVVGRALERVNALDLAGRDFTTLSDGQKQRIMLARAICQEPDLLVLDEPTAYLDIRHKIELLDILRSMAREENITVIMSLHEIDLATKISDRLLCVGEDGIESFGPPGEVMKEGVAEELYDIQSGSYNLLFGSVELHRPQGEPRVFVIGGGGRGIPCYRELQKRDIPFAAGVLFENDVDCQVACKLSEHVVSAPPFEPMTEEHFDRAAKVMLGCKAVIDAGAAVGRLNVINARLIALARERGMEIYRP